MWWASNSAGLASGVRGVVGVSVLQGTFIELVDTGVSVLSGFCLEFGGVRPLWFVL